MDAINNLFFHVRGRTWVVGVREQRTEEDSTGSVGLAERRCTVSVR